MSDSKIVDLVVYDDIRDILSRTYETEEDFERAIVQLYRHDRRLDIAQIQMRFLIGCFAVEIGSHYGKSTVDKIASRNGLSVTTLREARRFAKKLGSDPDRLKRWIEQQLSGGGQIFWADVQRFIGADSDPKVLGPKRLVKRLVGRTENLGMDLEKVNSLLEEIPEEEREGYERQVEGAVGATLAEVRRFRQHSDKLRTKPGAPRSSDYLDFIRSFPCSITGEYPVEAHHTIGKKKTGRKASDFGAIPLSSELHREFHNIGVKSFQRKYRTNVRTLVMNYLHRYLTGQWLTRDLGEPVE